MQYCVHSTPKRVKELTEECEKRMLKWLHQFVDKNIKSLLSYKGQKLSNNLPMSETFEFDNSLQLGEDLTPGFLDDYPFDEEN